MGDAWRKPYGPIQGQGKGQIQVVLKVSNSSIFKIRSSIFQIYLLHHFQWKLASDYWFLN